MRPLNNLEFDFFKYFINFYKLWVVLRYIAKFVLVSIRYTRDIDLQVIKLHSKMLQICMILDIFDVFKAV